MSVLDTGCRVIVSQSFDQNYEIMLAVIKRIFIMSTAPWSMYAEFALSRLFSCRGEARSAEPAFPSYPVYLIPEVVPNLQSIYLPKMFCNPFTHFLIAGEARSADVVPFLQSRLF